MSPSQRSFFDAKVARHFVAAMDKTVQSYFQKKPVLKEPLFFKSEVPAFDVAATVRFRSHEVEASMSLCARRDLAMALYETMFGEKPADLSPDVEDLLGELANTIYGAAKAPLVDDGFEFPMARPTTTRAVADLFKGAWSMELPFELENGSSPFALILSVHRLEPQKAAA